MVRGVIGLQEEKRIFLAYAAKRSACLLTRDRPKDDERGTLISFGEDRSELLDGLRLIVGE